MTILLIIIIAWLLLAVIWAVFDTPWGGSWIEVGQRLAWPLYGLGVIVALVANAFLNWKPK